MTGCDEAPEPDSVPYTETQESFSQYMASMCMNADNRINRVLSAGPLDVYSVQGWTSHLMVFNPHPDHDHDDLEQAIFRRIGPQWHVFAVVFNVAEKWEIAHLEPIAESRPLQECT